MFKNHESTCQLYMARDACAYWRLDLRIVSQSRAKAVRTRQQWSPTDVFGYDAFVNATKRRSKLETMLPLVTSAARVTVASVLATSYT
jgi:hypothetical protein